MGIWMSRLLSMFGEKEARILVLGLDNAGKTTILCKHSPAVILVGPLTLQQLTPVPASVLAHRPVAGWRGRVHHSK
jgi:hypothetical protein